MYTTILTIWIIGFGIACILGVGSEAKSNAELLQVVLGVLIIVGLPLAAIFLL